MSGNMVYSKHNIFSPLADSGDFYLLNPLTGQADILSPDEAELYKNGHLEKSEFYRSYVEKGYLTERDDEKKRFKRAYLDFVDQRDKEEVQVFFVPTYSCNFHCFYCYQNEYEQEHSYASKEVMDAFFQYVKENFSGRSKYITLFGGEPLLGSRAVREKVKYFIEKTKEAGLTLAVVTNGYEISSYIDILNDAPLREVQVTLDGPRELQNKRRPHKSAPDSFEKVSQGIDLLLQNKIPVNLRTVVDRENIGGLVDLAAFSAQKGWTAQRGFKTQLGRNYELHTCQANQTRLFSRLEMYEELYKIIKDHPEFLNYHKPAFSISKFLFENGKMPEPLFDSCPACKSEWAFDLDGGIYSCTATVGKNNEKLGTFFPDISLDEDLVEMWQERDVMGIRQCRDCELALTCGGGCGSVAKNQEGRIDAPDCRPTNNLMSLGIALYKDREF